MQQKKYNIISIISDDTDPHYVGACGGGKYLTPNLDRLAWEGTRFTQAHVVSPMCVPGRYCYLTGQYPHRSRPFLAKTPLGESYALPLGADIELDQPTLATVLKSNGYRTGYVGKYHNGGSPEEIPDLEPYVGEDPYNHAQDELRKSNQEAICKYMNTLGWDFAKSISLGNLDDRFHKTDFNKAGPWSHNQEWITASALEFLDQQKGSSQPFCLYMATQVIHGPEHARNIVDLDPKVTYGVLLEEAPQVQPTRQSIIDRLEAAGVESGHRSVGMLWLDDAVGAIIEKVEAMGLMEDTLIIYKADHGVVGKWSCYDDGTNVPHIWRIPGKHNAGGVCRQMVQNIDFLPTIADICGLEIPSDMQIDGHSYREQLHGSQEPVHEAILGEMGYQRSLRTNRWKLILNYLPPSHIEKMKSGEAKIAYGTWGREKLERSDQEHRYAYDAEQLYDLSVDPEEQINLAQRAEFQDILAEMKSELFKRLDTFERPYPKEPDPYMLSDDYKKLVQQTRENCHLYEAGPWYTGAWY